MTDVYAVTISTKLYVLANNEVEAETLAGQFGPDIGEYEFTYSAYRTPNQTDYIKRQAANYPIGDATQVNQGSN